MSATGTRRRILDAALRSFLDDGLEQTTVARIRERSGVSNGALFHHFPSKDAIADALYLEGISSFQEGLWKIVESHPRSLRAAIRGTLAHQLAWTEEHPDLARFVYRRGHLEWDSAAASEVASLNRKLAGAVSDWLAPLVQTGEVRPMSMLMITAIVSGPAHAICRRWLAGQVDRRPTAFLDELADAAWAGLCGKPVPVRGGPPPARLGRMRLELLSEDGSVLAHGFATAELSMAGASDESITR
jgi:AcrR family transcriptional regulator